MAYGGFWLLSAICGLKVWMWSVGVVLLLGKVSHGNLILFPECVDVVCWAEGKAYGTVPRPGHHFEARTVQLAEKIAVDVLRHPCDEVSGMAVALRIVPTFRTVRFAVESAVHHAYGIRHTLDELPEHRTVAVVADALWFQLEGMGEFVEQHATGLEVHVRSVVAGKGTFTWSVL